MKVPLETTTVREMLSKGGECLLCDLEAKAEAQLIRYFLGNSVMQPQIRVKVNRSGFCAPHFQALYKEGNRLGLALITHTHLLETWKRIREREKGLDNPSPNASGAPNGKALKRSSAGKRQRANAAGLIRLLKDRKEACLIWPSLTSLPGKICRGPRCRIGIRIFSPCSSAVLIVSKKN